MLCFAGAAAAALKRTAWDSCVCSAFCVPGTRPEQSGWCAERGPGPEGAPGAGEAVRLRLLRAQRGGHPRPRALLARRRHSGLHGGPPPFPSLPFLIRAQTRRPYLYTHDSLRDPTRADIIRPFLLCHDACACTACSERRLRVPPLPSCRVRNVQLTLRQKACRVSRARPAGAPALLHLSRSTVSVWKSLQGDEARNPGAVMNTP